MKKLTDGRKPVLRSLPPLAEACADFSGFKKGDNRTERLFDLLMVLIQRCRSAKPQPFYAMRDIATFFKVSLNTASRVYRRLDQEGALTRVRSSQTMLAPRTPRPRFAVRGVVCMPIWLTGFLHLLDWRRYFSELEEELFRHRFVLEPVFYKQGEEVSSDFVDRVLKFNPDYVLWNGPAETDRMTMESIADAGVRILTVLQLGAKSLPGRIYRTSYDRALRRGVADWEASGEIDRIVVVHLRIGSKNLPTPGYISLILQDCGLPHEFAYYDYGSPLQPYFKRLAKARRTGIMFADDVFFSRLCALATEEMFNLFRRHRVMLSRRVTMQSLAIPAGVTVDWLPFPHRRMAQRIAADLSQSKGTLPSTEEVFEAEWRPHTPLEDLVQVDLYE